MKNVVITTVMAILFASACIAEEQVAIGARAPGLSLVNAVDGKMVTMKPDDGVLKVVVFTCNQCPYARAFEPRIIEIAKEFQARGVRFYAVDPNDDVKFPEETLENMKARAVEKGYPYPYLKDGDSAVARAYGARVTPHVFVIDGTGTIRYRGYVDDSAKPEVRKTTGLSDALDAILGGREVTATVTREFGCTIKWKA